MLNLINWGNWSRVVSDMSIFRKKGKEPVRLHKQEQKKRLFDEMALVRLGIVFGIILLMLLLVLICCFIIPPTLGFYWW